MRSTRLFTKVLSYRWQSLELPIDVSTLDHEIASLGVTELAQRGDKICKRRIAAPGPWMEDADTVEAATRLTPPEHRGPHERTSNGEEGAAIHWQYQTTIAWLRSAMWWQLKYLESIAHCRV